MLKIWDNFEFDTGTIWSPKISIKSLLNIKMIITKPNESQKNIFKKETSPHSSLFKRFLTNKFDSSKTVYVFEPVSHPKVLHLYH